jgi:hypothetical protein
VTLKPLTFFLLAVAAGIIAGTIANLIALKIAATVAQEQLSASVGSSPLLNLFGALKK